MLPDIFPKLEKSIRTIRRQPLRSFKATVLWSTLTQNSVNQYAALAQKPPLHRSESINGAGIDPAPLSLCHSVFFIFYHYRSDRSPSANDRSVILHTRSQRYYPLERTIIDQCRHIDEYTLQHQKDPEERKEKLSPSSKRNFCYAQHDPNMSGRPK